jgi:Flp pilus assembly protein CpaB
MSGNGFAAEPARRVRRRTGLPGTRAVVGALLMAGAALGVYLAHLEATQEPTTRYVVAARDLDAGAVLTAGDLALEVIDLPAATAARAFRSIEDLTGHVALAPVGAGEVVWATAVTGTERVDPAHEVALVLPRAHVAVARLQRGDRVDIFATAGSRTASIVRGALVVSATGGQGGAIAQEREVEVVVAVPSGEAVAAVVHALRTGDVTIVRSTFAEAGTDEVLAAGDESDSGR